MWPNVHFRMSTYMTQQHRTRVCNLRLGIVHKLRLQEEVGRYTESLVDAILGFGKKARYPNFGLPKLEIT